MGFSGISSGMTKLANTPIGGFPLVNGTPTILAYTFPNDGNNHSVLVGGEKVTSSAETGGAIEVTATDPLGSNHNYSLVSGSQGLGSSRATVTMLEVPSGSTVTVSQQTALTAGASIYWGSIWGA